ncbi:MAG: GNAT family N-acetyltransferase [Pseudomonadota bacterium]
MPMQAEKAAAIRIELFLKDVAASDWDCCANPGWSLDAVGNPLRSDDDSGGDAESLCEELPYNPFVSHAFLSSLEESGSAVAETGWLGQHLLLEGEDGRPAAVAPCYLKSHSRGEYVFDYGWADAFERAGGRYYPKLQISVPFTPATGRRLLVADPADTEIGSLTLGTALAELCNRNQASSAHLTFLTKPEWDLLGKAGFLRRTDQQFHWEDEGYGGFDGFLEALASRKRKTLKRERREALKGGEIEVEWVSGKDITEAQWDAFFDFYMDTGARKWGRPYLNRDFFSLVTERLGNRVVLILAKRAGRYIAGALNVAGSETLFGRHWGCVEDHPFLHFELCYYQAIDYALAHGMKRVEAGAQGAHKLARGYLPTTTYSAHFIANPSFRDAIDRYLAQERAHVEYEAEMLAERSPFRRTQGD